MNFLKFITRWKRATGRGCSFLSLILNRRIELNIKTTPKWLLSFLVPNRWMLLFLVSEIIAVPNIFFLPISSFSFFPFHDGGPYHTETRPLIYRLNQWTGFYIIGTSAMEQLNSNLPIQTQTWHWKNLKIQIFYFIVWT